VGCRICKSDARGGGKAKNFTQRAESAEYAERRKIPRRKQAGTIWEEAEGGKGSGRFSLGERHQKRANRT
jgi:hypothetical protein